jgi:cell division protein FtsL
VTNNDNYVQGNTVLVPQRVEKTKDNRLKELEEGKNKLHKKKISKRISSKVCVIRNISLVFIVGALLIARYSAIYDMQRNLNTIKSSITETSRENENLKVELVKYNNLRFIEETATTKLHMIQPDKNAAVYVSLDKNYFSNMAEKDNKMVSQQNLIQKIKNLLF